MSEVVEQRIATHGPAQDTLQGAGRAIRELGISWVEDSVLRVCAMQIVLKLARVCFGNAEHKDHWLDIQGYAQIALDRITDQGGDPDDAD